MDYGLNLSAVVNYVILHCFALVLCLHVISIFCSVLFQYATLNSSVLMMLFKTRKRFLSTYMAFVCTIYIPILFILLITEIQFEPHKSVGRDTEAFFVLVQSGMNCLYVDVLNNSQIYVIFAVLFAGEFLLTAVFIYMYWTTYKRLNRNKTPFNKTPTPSIQRTPTSLALTNLSPSQSYTSSRNNAGPVVPLHTAISERTWRMQQSLFKSIVAQSAAIVLLYFLPINGILLMVAINPELAFTFTMIFLICLVSYAPLACFMMVCFVGQFRQEILNLFMTWFQICTAVLFCGRCSSYSGTNSNAIIAAIPKPIVTIPSSLKHKPENRTTKASASS
ncbi:serpentine type 7TM GPCR chemoreceptor srh domain-containing protein [Ditylenchus destructor]|nr:serpentine type 7TM GPCR chemoreceptor srh domain-containing protein [Ditylenchus destructor]